MTPARPHDPGTAPEPPAAGALSRTVLEAGDIRRALTRVAHEILERNKGGADLVVVGIPTRGVTLAGRLATRLGEIEDAPVPVGSLDVTMYRDDLRRQPTRTLAITRLPPGGIDDKVVVLVDDVLYSGRTIRAALDALSDLGRPRAVRLAVLVDRGHRDLPIRADHVGKNLPTSHTERVRVLLEETDGRDAVVIDNPVGADDGASDDGTPDDGTPDAGSGALQTDDGTPGDPLAHAGPPAPHPARSRRDLADGELGGEG